MNVFRKLSKAMNAAEREFLAENEIVEIVPAFAHSILTLIQVFFLLETVNVLIWILLTNFTKSPMYIPELSLKVNMMGPSLLFDGWFQCVYISKKH